MHAWQLRRCVTGAMCTTIIITGFGGCVPSSGDSAPAVDSSKREFPLDEMPTSTVAIGASTFRVWVADDTDERNEGLMYIAPGALAADQGMLFVFDSERILSFWMANTYLPLDIAFARSDGEIVKIHTMTALTRDSYSSVEPARFALEVNAGVFEQLGVREGDRIVIPDEVFKQGS